MKKKATVIASMVYRPTRLYSQIDGALAKEVSDGKHKSFNSAINHHLQKSLRIDIPAHLTLANLSLGDTFKFTTTTAYKIYKVKEGCKRSKRLGCVVRKCEIIETGKIVSPRCDREVIKIE